MRLPRRYRIVLKHGAKLVISGSNTEKLTKTVQRLRTSYPHVKDQIVTEACDLWQTFALEDNLRRLFKTVSENGTKWIDHIVFTSSDRLNLTGGIPLAGTDLNVFNSIMKVRVFAPTLIAKIIATFEFVNKSITSSFTLTSGTAHLRPPKTWAIVTMTSGALLRSRKWIGS